ncbi:putative tryptophan 2,3-dioxygenase [Streptomyces lincolnensis]|uniref:Tryptophan 2,3-dioxygenase n=1 Tax=Streptomyces lincolnensis TaxID=1915 RepID=A0A1B1MQ09_STRLN|nr:tryptophan 2,3-dioxygenase family protein [Streptomyces lincolnensis]ANS70597.1 putative tryptophan 2,3-dioxygenase [Streptomyces lincolnensis]
MTDTTSLPRPAGTDDPLVTFQGKTPYDDYVHASVLSSLQQPLTDAPDEMAFLVTTQVMELWFTLVVHEWRSAREALVKDDHTRAMDALRRSISAHHALNDSLRPIARMTPAQFNGFRAAFGAASGFQSAKYRQMEFLLGDKSRSMMNTQREDPEAYAELEELLSQPSLYDEILAHLHRRDLPVPEHVLQRDVTAPYEADPQVEEVWRLIYAGPQDDPLLDLAEALTDIAEMVMRWRADHLLAVRRAMGSKTGSGGSSGVAWLEKRAARPVFPEIWTVRGRV